MAFDGNGTFLRIMNWVADAAAAIKIKADRHDQQDDDFAAGLSNCITKDGQTQPTANLPMNGKKLVNLGDPSDDGDAANKKYVDAVKTFSKGLEISGADDLGRLKFTSTTGVNGLAFTGADFAWVARLATASPVTKNRMVLNDKPDGSGNDVMTVNDDGSVAAKVNFAAPTIVAKANAAGQAAVTFLGNTGAQRASIYTNGDAQGNLVVTVNGQNYQFDGGGGLRAPAAVFAGSSYLGNDGNITGSIWGNWGAGDAFSAISARIENRAAAFANDRIQALQYRKVSLGFNNASGGFTNIGGAVIVGYARDAGNTGQVSGLYYMFLQVFDPVRGWVGFSG